MSADLMIESHGPCTLLQLRRERLDAAYAPTFRQVVQELVGQGHRQIVLDLAQVNFVDSTGLGALVSLLKQTQVGGELVLCGIQEPVQRLFKLTHMDRVFTICADVATGLASLQS